MKSYKGGGGCRGGEGETTKTSSSAATKVATAAASGSGYYGVLFDVDATAVTRGGGGITSAGVRYGADGGGENAWGGMDGIGGGYGGGQDCNLGC